MKYEARQSMQDSGYADLANMFIMGLMGQNTDANQSDYEFLKFEVSRDNIIEDTLNNLTREGTNLKKKLKVKFRWMK